MTDTDVRDTQDPGYRKVDRRHTAETEPESSDAAESPAAEPAGADQGAAGAMPTLVDLDVYDLLRFAWGLFVEKAWVELGIHKAPAADDVRTDIPRAKVAIETVRALTAQLEGQMEPAEAREAEQTIANLQINFVKRSGA